MYDIIIKNGTIVNENQIIQADIAIKDDIIVKIEKSITSSAKNEIDAEGLFVLPGVIDDQVHFREPGFTHKANIMSESKAAVAGGVTSFMEMPNTNPQTTTIEEWNKKNEIGARTSYANYSFFFGATNDNLEEVKKVDPRITCGVKIFMGSSTGNMLVDNAYILEEIFKHSPTIIATHCEDEETIKNNLEQYLAKYGKDGLSAIHHPLIRNEEGCHISSSKAIDLALKTNARLHILHISTEKETLLFDNTIPLLQKRITAEVCVHHLFFNDSMYPTLGNKIKCNPAIKSKNDQQALFKALIDDRFDVIATDHAPHTIEEKAQRYLDAPSGLPLIQHSLQIMLDFHQKGKISLEKLVEKMCHAPADLFRVHNRGYLKEGYYADIVLVDQNKKYTIQKENVLYNCGWSPLENRTFNSQILTTIINGKVVYNLGKHTDLRGAKQLIFNKY